jgi:hypothetical protein
MLAWLGPTGGPSPCILLQPPVVAAASSTAWISSPSIRQASERCRDDSHWLRTASGERQPRERLAGQTARVPHLPASGTAASSLGTWFGREPSASAPAPSTTFSNTAPAPILARAPTELRRTTAAGPTIAPSSTTDATTTAPSPTEVLGPMQFPPESCADDETSADSAIRNSPAGPGRPARRRSRGRRRH